jgi:hypothetical protein
VKQIIEMNRQQQYPERLEDYQVELMSTSALASEGNSEEVEREIARLSEGGNGVVGEERPRKAEPEQRRERDRGDRRPKVDRSNRDKERTSQPKRNNNNGNNNSNNRPRREGGDRDRRSGGNRDRRG